MIATRHRTALSALALASMLAAPSQARSGGLEANVSVACEATPQLIGSAFARWVGLIGRRATLDHQSFLQQADALVAETFDAAAMSRWILDDDWDDLDDVRRSRFVAALERALRSRMLDQLAGATEVPTLEAVNQQIRREGEFQRLPYILINPNGRPAQSIWVVDAGNGACRIADLRGGGAELVKDFRKQAKDVWDDFSFEQMIADVGNYDYVVLEDFERTPEGQLPVDWTWRGGDNDKNKPYAVLTEDGNKFLQAQDRGESVILGREVEWDSEAFPYVSFRVRIWRVPEGGDERYDDLVDSAAGVYVTLNKKLLGKIPESVKYVWSSTLPVGAAVRREGIGKPWQVVFGTGTDGIGEWRTYVFDARQAYADTFGGNPGREAAGVGVLSDANSLRTDAWADYDDFRALRTAPAGVTSGVREIMPPLGRKNARN